MDYSNQQEIKEGIGNIEFGTSIAAGLQDSASSREIKELAKAVHFIGFGAQQVAKHLQN